MKPFHLYLALFSVLSLCVVCSNGNALGDLFGKIIGNNLQGAAGNDCAACTVGMWSHNLLSLNIFLFFFFTCDFHLNTHPCNPRTLTHIAHPTPTPPHPLPQTLHTHHTPSPPTSSSHPYTPILLTILTPSLSHFLKPQPHPLHS